MNYEKCPMKEFHEALRKAINSLNEEVIVCGDTGCSYQGSKPPYETIDSFLCMGTSASMASGVDLAGYEGKVAAVMGDSSFLHSGIQSLMNSVYHKSKITLIIFDNQRTGETGRQANPGTGRDFQDKKTNKVEIKELVDDCKVDDIEVLNDFNQEKNASVISSFIEREEMNVVILKGACYDNCPL